jgi:hypothetical protein
VRLSCGENGLVEVEKGLDQAPAMKKGPKLGASISSSRALEFWQARAFLVCTCNALRVWMRTGDNGKGICEGIIAANYGAHSRQQAR